MRLSWTHRAKDDLLSIGRFIARDHPATARAFVAKLQARARRAAKYPRSGRVVPELRREDVREVIQGNYRIVYRLTKEAPPLSGVRLVGGCTPSTPRASLRPREYSPRSSRS